VPERARAASVLVHFDWAHESDSRAIEAEDGDIDDDVIVDVKDICLIQAWKVGTPIMV